MVFSFPKWDRLTSVPIHEVIVPEEDHNTFSISHPQHLLLIDTPLATEADAHHGHGSHFAAPAKTPNHAVHEFRNDSTSSSAHESGHDAHAVVRDPDQPTLKRAHEAPTIQLFFDLFFVANLTTFTTIHEVDDWSTLKSYLGYFALIWFTWFQNTLFDVRFSNDSAFERVCKAMQFGIMTGFAVTGPGYNTGWSLGTPEAVSAIDTFRTLSLILMTSRLILTFQYGVALWFVRGYKKAILPMVLHMVVLFTSAMIWLGQYYAFTAHESEHILISWYCIIAVESLVILLVSGHIKFLSFRETVLVERCGLLTLIILGEGIIGMCGAINKVGSDKTYSPEVIAMIISSVGIMYFLWMLYFDQVQPERMGTLRQHIWAVLHFPFHISILLVVEGLSRLSVWRKLLDIMVPLRDSFTTGLPQNATLEAQVIYLKKTLFDIYGKFESSGQTQIEKPDLQNWYDEIANSDGNKTAVSEAINQVYAGGVTWVLHNFKIEPPKSSDAESDTDTVKEVFKLYNTVFVYFFTFAGLALILLAILFMLGKRHKLRGELLSVCVRIFFGVGISLLTLMAIPTLKDRDNSAFDAYMYSAWMLPTVLISYFIVIVLDNLLIRYIVSVVHWRQHLHTKSESA